MLFTDGGEERAEEFFKKYNPKQAVGLQNSLYGLEYRISFFHFIIFSV